MKIHKKIEQGTPEWVEIRKLKLTASNAQAIGNIGKGLETYVRELVASSYATEIESYTNEHIERGLELEPLARAVYELEKGVKVEQVGFIERDGAGCSPDGLVGEEGGLEIKCLSGKKYIDVLADGLKGVDTKYIWQVQMSLYITGRKWWDLMFYNPDMPKSDIIFRIEPDKEAFAKLEEGIKVGKARIKELKKLTE